MAKRNYEQIALCVLTSPNLKAAAEKAGVSYNTLKRYIDLIQCLQKEGFRLPDDPALNDLMENHSRFSLEELVERYQDRRWFDQ